MNTPPNTFCDTCTWRTEVINISVQWQTTAELQTVESEPFCKTKKGILWKVLSPWLVTAARSLILFFKKYWVENPEGDHCCWGKGDWVQNYITSHHVWLTMKWTQPYKGKQQSVGFCWLLTPAVSLATFDTFSATFCPSSCLWSYFLFLVRPCHSPSLPPLCP